MLVTPEGIVRLPRPMQPMNALLPILVKVAGSVAPVMPVQFAKALLPMAVTGLLLMVSGTTTVPVTDVRQAVMVIVDPLSE